MQYFSTLQKWDSLREGQLAQRMPSYVPGRDYMSSSRARTLKIPCTKKDALMAFEALEEIFNLNSHWIGSDISMAKQKEAVIQALNLGAFSLPKLVLDSHLIDMHLRDLMQKEVNRCFENLRKGKDSM